MKLGTLRTASPDGELIVVSRDFTRMARATDIAPTLQAALDRLQASQIGIVIKIETRIAFERLPGILLQALRGRRVGVMIARGDLAVECGWQRLAEVQEEILWVCEAAHIPVIWATQVLENLAKKGTPSRAEITDAAMGERAECTSGRRARACAAYIFRSRGKETRLERGELQRAKADELIAQASTWGRVPGVVRALC